jgi:6-phosphofructokinase 1
VFENKSNVKTVGILTAGGDCPGLNAVIRAIAKTLIPEGVKVYGFLEGFKGLVENHYMDITDKLVSGLLTVGGTVLRSSRDKPHKMPAPNGDVQDRTEDAIQTYRRLGLDCLICIGGGGTQKSAYRLMEAGDLNVVTVPKTIDNDVYGTDTSFGFDTAMYVATEAIDRLHTTATSHHRVMVVDIMGHNTGWLALGSGIAGGADVILIPEIPYDMDVIADSLLARMARGKMFSIVAMAEGAKPKKNGEKGNGSKKNGNGHTKEPVSAILAEHIESVTGLETRVTSLGYIQRGGVPTPTDRLLCTKYGTEAARLILNGQFGSMIAKRGQEYVGVPIEEIVGKRREVPIDHAWVVAARAVSTCLGDEMPHGYR